MKKLSVLLIKSYIGPFVLTFCIAQFVLIMQFLWKYIDDLVGKGLDSWVIFKLMVFVSATLVPMALPLAILLSSIMTFGAFGESYELTAIKSTGVSFIRFMRPLMIFIFILSIGAFFFSNNIIPFANLKSGALLYDIRKQKPTLNIKPGVFNDDIQGITIFAGSKDPDGKTMRDLIIYDHTQNSGNTDLIMAKKGQLLQTKKGDVLIFKLDNGVQYKEDLSVSDDKKYQLFQTNFDQWEKHFDLSQFALQKTDEIFFKDVSRMCNISQLQTKIDTVRGSIQSRKNNLYDNLKAYLFFSNPRFDSIAKATSTFPIVLSNIKGLDLVKNESRMEQQDIIEVATAKARNIKSYTGSSTKDIFYLRSDLNEFKVEYHRKFKLTFICILFFFIGAPLGAIIRKGGLGWPIFFSIIIFIFFYAINIIGERIAEGSTYQVFTGTWMSVYVLTPMAIFLTIKANSDSSIFNKDTYLKKTKRLFQFFQKKETIHA